MKLLDLKGGASVWATLMIGQAWANWMSLTVFDEVSRESMTARGAIPLTVTLPSRGKMTSLRGVAPICAGV